MLTNEDDSIVVPVSVAVAATVGLGLAWPIAVAGPEPQPATVAKTLRVTGSAALLDVMQVSDVTAHAIDEEVRLLIDTCYAEAKEILEGNRDKLDLMAAALLAPGTTVLSNVPDILDVAVMAQLLERVHAASSSTSGSRNRWASARRAPAGPRRAVAPAGAIHSSGDDNPQKEYIPPRATRHGGAPLGTAGSESSCFRHLARGPCPLP